MKHITSAILVFLYLNLLLAPLLPYLDYALHKEHIIMHHCENPDSDCDGVCYLKKQVDHHQTDPAFIVQNIFQILFIELNEDYSNQFFKNTEFYHSDDKDLKKGFIRQLLIPPRA
jgi:hypothetical protein